MTALKAFLEEYRALNAPSKVLLVAVILLGTAVGSASVVAVVLGPREALVGGLLLVLSTWLASSRPIRFPGSESSVSVSETFIFIAVMLFGAPLAALLAAFDGFVSSRKLTAKRTSVLYSVANLSISAFVAGVTYWIILERVGIRGGPGRVPSDAPLYLVALAVIVLALTHYVCNVGLLTLMIWAKYGKNPLRVWRDNYLWAVTTFLAGGTAAAFAFYAVQIFGYAWMLIGIVLALPIPILIYHTFRTYQEKFEARARHVQEVNTVYRATVEALAMAIDAKDQTSHQHIRRVQLFSQRLGEMVGLGEGELRALDIASLLHDVGKLGVPEYILNKPGKLTEAELGQVRLHPVIGAEILRNVDFPYPVVEMIRSHHEHWDGSGYPDGLKGEAIPLGARILSLVDFYDALLSDRPFRKALARSEALDAVLAQRATRFDSRLVDLFLAHIDRLEEEVAAQSVEMPDFSSLRAATLQPAGAPPDQPITDVFERIAEVNQQVAVLCDISRRLGSADSTSDLLAVLATRLPGLVPFTTCALHVVQPHGQPTRVISVLGERADLFRERGFRPGEGITGWVIANGQPMVNTSPLLDLSALGHEIATAYRSAMVFPIGGESGLIGAISLYSCDIDRFTDEHVCLIESLLAPIADTLRHTLRLEGAQYEATTDRLTGLPNARAFDEQCAREVARARRFKQPLAILLLGVEGLEAVEAQHGVAAAERARLEIASLLGKHLREVDYAARYTENGFAVLLVMTNPSGASRTAHRLTQALDNHAFAFDGAALAVRPAIGFASWPQDGDLTEELLAAARHRLAAQGSKTTRPANIIPFTERMNQVG